MNRPPSLFLSKGKTMNKRELLRIFYHLTVIGAGFTTLALEIIASRMLMPQFGLTLDIWGAVLVVTLSVLAAGYFWGEKTVSGSLAEKIPGKYVRNAFCAVVLVFAGVLGFYPLTGMFTDLPLFIGAALSSFILIGPCFFFTATLTPLLVMIETLSQGQEKTKAIGHTGIILAESTIGSVIGALVCVYGLIPNMSVEIALIYLLAPLFVSSSVLVVLHSRFMGLKIRGIQLLAIMLAGTVFFSGLDVDARQINFGNTIATQLEVQRTRYGTIRLIRVPLPAEQTAWLYLLLDGRTQNILLEKGENAIAYTNAAVNSLLNMPKKPKDVLILGGGAGVIARDLANSGVSVDMVEINGAFEPLAKKYFYLPDMVNFYVEDARTFLNRCSKTYDAIVFDIFTGYGAPEHLVTKEAYQAAKECLNPGGVVSLNLLRDPKDTKPDATIKATLSAVFSYVDLYSPIKAETPIVNGLWLASDETLPVAQLSGGATPGFINEELKQNWKYQPVSDGGEVSTDNFPAYVFETKELFREEHSLTRDIYGVSVMKP